MIRVDWLVATRWQIVALVALALVTILLAACVDTAATSDRAADAGVVVHELTPRQPSLEEAFMKLTADSVQFHGVSRDAPDHDGELSRPAEAVSERG